MAEAKPHLRRVALVIAGSLIALALSEGLVRVLYPYSRDHVVPSGFFVIDDQLGWRLSADTSVTHRTRYFDVAYETNALGYRDRPREPSKDSQHSRVLLYGDSQVFGWGVPAGSRFSDRIEAQSSQREVWNLAVPGYGLDQEVLSYELRGAEFEADEVVFFVDDYTLARIRSDFIYRKHKPRFSLQGGTLTLMPIVAGATAWSDVLYRVLSPLYLPYFLERRLAMLREVLAPPQNSGVDIPGAAAPLGALERRILERAAGIARERGHRMTLLVYAPGTPKASLKRYCQESGVGFLEVVVPQAPGLRFGEEDLHWTPEAHRLIAEQVLAQLAER